MSGFSFPVYDAEAGGIGYDAALVYSASKRHVAWGVRDAPGPTGHMPITVFVRSADLDGDGCGLGMRSRPKHYQHCGVFAYEFSGIRKMEVWMELFEGGRLCQECFDVCAELHGRMRGRYCKSCGELLAEAKALRNALVARESFAERRRKLWDEIEEMKGRLGCDATIADKAAVLDQIMADIEAEDAS